METRAKQTFSIAVAAVSDCLQCASLLVEQLSEHGVDASIDQLSSVLEKAVTDGTRAFLLLARDDSRIVGVAYVATIPSVEHCGPVAWLEELYVAPSHRSRGIGSALVAAVVERARAGGMVAVDLEIDSAHRRAASLYERLGFHRLESSRWAKKLITDVA